MSDIGWPINTDSSSIYTCGALTVPEYITCDTQHDYEIVNMEWNVLCKYINVVNIVDTNSMCTNVDPNQVLLSDIQTSTKHTTLHISSSKHLIPIVKNINTIHCTITPNNNGPNTGIIIQQQNDLYKTFSFIPFGSSRKLFSVLAKHDGMYHVVYVKCCSTSERVTQKLGLHVNKIRNKQSVIQQLDKVHCLSVSNKFLSIAESSNTIEVLYKNIMSQLYKTVDVSYMLKILNLLNKLSIED